MCFNGCYVTKKDPLFSGTEQGLLLGDGLFESMRVYDGKVFQIEAHWARLEKSSKFFRYSLPNFSKTLSVWIKELLSMNQIEDGYLRLTVTRGERKKPGLRMEKSHPNILIEASSLSFQEQQWTLALSSVRRSTTSKVTCHKSSSSDFHDSQIWRDVQPITLVSINIIFVRAPPAAFQEWVFGISYTHFVEQRQNTKSKNIQSNLPKNMPVSNVQVRRQQLK